MNIVEPRVSELEKDLAERTAELNQRKQELAVINSVFRLASDRLKNATR